MSKMLAKKIPFTTQLLSYEAYSVIWKRFMGVLPLPKNNPIESLHIMFCKHLVGVHKSMTNNGVLLEQGRVPLTLFEQKASIKKWKRIRKTRCYSLLSFSYKAAVDEFMLGNCLWVPNIKATLAQ